MMMIPTSGGLPRAHGLYHASRCIVLCIILMDVILQQYLQYRPSSHTTFPRISTTVHAPTIPACYRPCKTYDNIIIFNLTKVIGAGLYDRQYILNETSNFAAYLCARLVVPSPHILLGALHNGGKNLSIDLTWKDDLFDIILLNDGSSAIIQLDNTTDLESSSRRLLNATVIEQEDVEQALSKGRDLVQHGKPFLWKINSGGFFYGPKGYDEGILPEIKKLENSTEGGMLPFKCQAVKMVPSPIVQSTTAKVLERLPASGFGYLHLRRGDSVDACNTTVAKVREYFACSMNGTMAPNNFTMVLATEETSTEYLNGIKEVLESNGFHYLHLDAIVNDVLEQQVNDGVYARHKLNNFLTFKIGTEVKGHASFSLERRRIISCHDCEPSLTEYLRKIAALDTTF